MGGYYILSMELLLQAVFDNFLSNSSPECEKSLHYLLPIFLLYLVVEFGGCISGFRLPSYPTTATMYHYVMFVLLLICCFCVYCIAYLLTLTGSVNDNSQAACCVLNSLFCQNDCIW